MNHKRRLLAFAAGLSAVALASVAGASSSSAAPTGATTLARRPARSRSGRTPTARPRSTAIASAWGAARGVNVVVVQKDFGKIRDDLQDGRGVDGSRRDRRRARLDGRARGQRPRAPALPVARRRGPQFPQYALDAFSYGTAVKRLYGAPVAIENIGLVVNTRLAKVPKNFVDLQRRRSRSSGRSRATSPSPSSRARPATRTTCTRSSPASAATSSARTAPATSTRPTSASTRRGSSATRRLIDGWNKTGLVNAKVDDGAASTAFLNKRAAFWITGPWNIDRVKKAGIRFPVVQMPRIRCDSVPFLGVQGFMVTKFASSHGVESAAKDLVGNYMMSQASQTALAAANGRYPANTRAGARVSRTRSLKAVRRRRARRRRRCRTSRRCRPSGPTSARRGSSRRRAPAPRRRGRPSRPRPATSRTRSASTITGGAPPGAPPASPTAWRRPPRPHSVPPAGVATGSAWSLPSRAVAALSGTVGLAIKIALLAIVNAIAVWAAVVLATDEQLGRARRPRRGDARDRRASTSPRARSR